MALRNKRDELIATWESRREYLNNNSRLLDIYSGNLLPYLQSIMKQTLSEKYYNSIRERLIPVNILDRYISKVSTAYSKPPVRLAEDKNQQDFVDHYSKLMDVNGSGLIIDSYSNLFKGYAWEPYINLKGLPQLRELPFDKFFVYSDSENSPEEETIFVKIVGKVGEKTLFFAYSQDEFDAFYSDKETAPAYLQENGGVNFYKTIPFVYGKRDKNKLYPVQDSDLYGMTTAIATMLSDGSGAQLYQSFSVLFGIDVDSDNLTISPNAFWNFKSNASSDKQPTVGVLKPTADTDKVMSFVTSVFTLWLETKGIRVGSVGTVQGQNAASGISKIIDEMDVYDIKKKSIKLYKKDEEELWNEKMKNIHNYWLDSGMVNPRLVPPRLPDSTEMDVVVVFDEPKPIIPRLDEIKECSEEVALGTMTMKQAVEKLHPEYSEEQVNETLNNRKIF